MQRINLLLQYYVFGGGWQEPSLVELHGSEVPQFISYRCQETRCQMLIELLCGSDFKNSLVGMKVRIALFGVRL